MGVTTSFFAASWDQLRAAAPGWVVPEYGPYVEVVVENPFTGQNMRVKRCELLTSPPGDALDESIHELIAPGRSYAWKLVGTELSVLMKVVLDASDEDVAHLGRFALIGSDDQETWVTEIPSAFVAALAALPDDQQEATAERWRVAIEWEEPPRALLRQLVDVAKETANGDKRMFAYVAL